jgi:hypothetical protein
MKNLDTLNSSLKRLNLNAEAEKRLHQIALVCNNIPVYETVNTVAANMDSNEFGSKTFYDKTNSFEKYEVTKEKSTRNNTTDKIRLETESKTPLTKGLTYYNVNNTTISNLTGKQVSVIENDNRIYFSGQNILSTNEALFVFNNKNDLININLKFTMTGGKNPSCIIKSFSEQDVAKMLNTANQQSHSGRHLPL